MYCKKCGKDYKKDKKVCKDCGIALTPGKSPENKKSNNLRMIIIASVVLVAILGVFLIIGFGGMLPEQLKGTWYDTSGIMGTIVFEPSGVAQRSTFGKTVTGSYTYNGGTGEGTLTFVGEENSHAFTCDGKNLTMDQMTYTKEYRDQVTVTS